MIKLCETCVHFRKYENATVFTEYEGIKRFVGIGTYMLCINPSKMQIDVDTDTNEEKCTGYADKRGCGNISVVKVGIIEVPYPNSKKEDD